jgi:hypothetical protein
MIRHDRSLHSGATARLRWCCGVVPLALVLTTACAERGRPAPAGDDRADAGAQQHRRGLVASARDALRDELGAPPAQGSPLARAAADLRRGDPAASFTWFRGHLDAFATRPRSSIAAYARPILERAGVGTTPVEPTPVVIAFGDVPAAPAPAPASGRASVASPADDLPPQDPAPAPVVGDDAVPEQSAPTPPSPGRAIVKDILVAFLATHRDLFEIDDDALKAGLPGLQLGKYGAGKRFHRAVFEQSVNGVPVVDGRVIVLLDHNWNVVAISRQLFTPAKLPVPSASMLDEGLAVARASAAVASTQGGRGGEHRPMKTVLGIDPIRGTLVWNIDLVDARTRQEFTVTLGPGDGPVLNVSDNTARYNDAQVRRWSYPGGDMTMATQVVSSGVYTHDDNTLVHDFFYMLNDDRNDGGNGTCSATAIPSNSTPAAYGTTTSTDHIRPTRRSDRDFSLWTPDTAEGSFGESHAYYWARQYMQWQKSALVDLGVLTTGSFANYPKTKIIVNACDDDAGHYTSSLAVSTLDDVGEQDPTIVLPEVCRAGNGGTGRCAASDYDPSKSGTLYTYEGGGGYHFPSVIHHELNHFVLIDTFGVANTHQCSTRDERQFFQEGGLGRTLPQMYWHHHYGVGYLPGTNLLFRAGDASGRPHDPADPTTLDHLDDYPCSGYAGDPYSWGGVVAQPMWEIYQGKKVDGTNLVGMGRPSTDEAMIETMYYAADMASASATKDRYELARRFMEFWELFGTAMASTKADWCAAWDHHGVGAYIDTSYCD